MVSVFCGVGFLVTLAVGAVIYHYRDQLINCGVRGERSPSLSVWGLPGSGSPFTLYVPDNVIASAAGAWRSPGNKGSFTWKTFYSPRGRSRRRFAPQRKRDLAPRDDTFERFFQGNVQAEH